MSEKEIKRAAIQEMCNLYTNALNREIAKLLQISD